LIYKDVKNIVGFSATAKQESKNTIEENTLLIKEDLYIENYLNFSVLTKSIRTLYIDPIEKE